MSLRKDIILAEIAGKNTAIGSYDNTVWMIRSGYLTLMFGGWAIVIQGGLEKAGDSNGRRMLAMMFIVSVSFTVGAFILDRNYERRKFRVIASLNNLLSEALKVEDVDHLSSADAKALHDLTRVAGDADNDCYQISGFQQARRAAVTLYVSALLAVAMALVAYEFIK